MGVVYLAFDRQRDELIAIKTIRRVGADSIYRLKREFRSNAQLSHPQLVKLHELFCVDQQWFFTMEYVEGKNLLEYLETESVRERSGGEAPRVSDGGPHARHANESSLESDQGEDAWPPPPTAAVGSSDQFTGRAVVAPRQLEMIRHLMSQLAEGVCQLHAAGTLHRDLKPTNALVTRDARVVILDFGLATQLEPDARSSTTEGLLVGTIPYMSPEQAKGKELTAASDWYSLGVILYEALTGRGPFVGRPLQMLTDKQSLDPPAPSTIIAGVPDDLDALCMQLLSRDPAARPSGAEVLRRLRARASPAPALTRPPQPQRHVPFVGRQQPLRELMHALHDVERGRTVVVSVEGESGIGKSALVRHFLEEAECNREMVILTGRCHECESVPYKALDSLVDALSHYLLRRPDTEIESLVPRDREPLLRVLPVLKRVKELAPTRIKEREPLDRQELRDRAFLALREMLGRLGDRSTLVLHIDDLQWSDKDSLSLLHVLLAPPDPPPLLLVICQRTSQESTTSFVRSLSSAAGKSHGALSVRTLVLEPLDLRESRQLVRSLWDSSADVTKTSINAIAASAAGNPYFLESLARYHCSGCDPERDSAPDVQNTLEHVLCKQIAVLDDPAQQLLRVVSVAGYPVRYLDARRAALLGEEAGDALAALHTARLVRTPGANDALYIEIYHDRIREAVVAQLSLPERTRIHRHLAEALEKGGHSDPATLAEHFVAAAEPEKGKRYFLEAAQHASDAFAFDRAAGLYLQASELSRSDTDQLRLLRTKCARALANAGRGADAAEQYEQAADDAPQLEAFELRRHAAMQYLFAGEVDRGLAALAHVLSQQSLHLPRGPRHALMEWLWLRAKLRMRGLRFRQVEESRVPPELLRSIDTCWSATAGLSILDPIAASVFQTRGLLLALRSGEPNRIARSLCLEAAHVSVQGGKKRGQVEALLERAETIACRLDNPHIRGLIRLAAGMAAVHQGRWRAARQHCDEADEIFRQQCTGVAWEMDCAAAGAATALYDAGEIAELAQRLPSLRDRARRRGNRFALTAPSSMNLPSLAADQPDTAQQILDDCMRHWSDSRFFVQHFSALHDQIQIDLYRGDPAAAWTRILGHRRAVARSLLMRVQLSRAFTYQTRARCALAMAQRLENPRSLLRLAEKDALRVKREGQHWTLPLAELLLAAVAAARGQTPLTIELLEKAVIHFDKADMVLYAAVSRRQLGIMCGGRSGAELIATARRWMNQQGVADLNRLCQMCAPGFPREALDGNTT